MNDNVNFKSDCAAEILCISNDSIINKASIDWMKMANSHKYSYHFEWQGRPIIQYPQDIIAMQELIFEVKPDLIIETGIAHGGSLIFSASMLALLDLYDSIDKDTTLHPKISSRKVVGIDIDIRPHNRTAIENHPLSSRIQMIQGSSIAPDIIKKVHDIAKDYNCIMLCLDSNHTHEHVLSELHAYASLTSVGSYCVVFDTVVEDMPKSMFSDRPWGPGDNPKTAVHKFLQTNSNFHIEKNIQNKLLITVAPDGYLKRVK